MHTQKNNLSEFDMSGQQGAPDMGAEQPVVELPSGEVDREGAMAKADLYKLANYAHKLFEKIHDEDQLEAWVQAKITKAADYMASVYHYLEYEMKFSEYGHHLDNSDTLSEGQKAVLKNRLMEAKSKIKELKKAQAEKVKESTDEKDPLTDKEDETAAEKRARLAKEKAKSAEPKKSSTGGTTTTKDGKTVHKSGKFYETADDTDAFAEETPAQKRARLAKEKAKEDAKASAPKKSSTGGETTTTGGRTIHKSGKHYEGVAEAKKKGDGNLANNAKPYDKVTQGDVVAGRLGKDEKGGKDVKEAAPSAGLSKAKKSAVVKDAKAGKDIGKPGKGFKKVAAKAAKEYGSKEKGEKVAAAAMWKNMKEDVKIAEAEKKAKQDYDNDGRIETGSQEHAGSVDKAIKASKAKETVKESADMTRMKQFLSRLNG